MFRLWRLTTPSSKTLSNKMVDRRFGARQRGVEREIQRLQSSSAPDLLIPKAAFGRLVSDIVKGEAIWAGGIQGEKGWTDEAKKYRMTSDALLCLQTSAEAFLLEVLEDCARTAHHAKMVQVMPKDLQFLRYIRNDPTLLPLPVWDSANSGSAPAKPDKAKPLLRSKRMVQHNVTRRDTADAAAEAPSFELPDSQASSAAGQWLQPTSPGTVALRPP